jgi:GNAT superfamily N-acetyltransferase
MTTRHMLLIQPAKSDGDLARCFPVLRELRPQLSPDIFLATMKRMKEGGYRLAFGESAGEVVVVGGYRFCEHLARGPYSYVDDLVTTASARRRGYGAQMLAWLVETAQAAGCAELHLDSGLARVEAHAFYGKLGMRFSSKHFSLKLA